MSCCACRERYKVAERELWQIAKAVSFERSGRARADRDRYERCGSNIKTMLKYMHVMRIWIDFCLANSMFHLRWDYASLTPEVWRQLVQHMHGYSSRAAGLSDGSLESYMRMLSHVLIFMAAPVGQSSQLHSEQRDVIQRVVDAHCVENPACRTIRNTKSAWSALLVDAALQLLLQWRVYGHCQMRQLMWPAFARLTLSMLNYLGWRPFSMTRDRVDKHDPRWCSDPILPFGWCRLIWQDNVLVAVQVFGKRTKFNRSPRQERDELGVLRDRPVLDGKLTYNAQVDKCACLAWLIWSILVGVWGCRPIAVVNGYVMLGAAGPGAAATLTSDVVDALVASIFIVCPSGVPVEHQDVPVFTDTVLHGGGQICTDRVSNVPHEVGMRLGLNPRKCSAVCGRKTVGTAIVNHSQATDMDCSRLLGHRSHITTKTRYADSTAGTADSFALLHGQAIRELPGSVALAHTRNLHPDIAAAKQAGIRAAAAVRPLFTSRHGAMNSRLERHNAYKQGFRREMQRQYDAQLSLPRAGNTADVLNSWFFTPLACSHLSQAEFVAWQVKVALGMASADVVPG